MRHDHRVESTRPVLKHISTLAPTITQIQREIRERGSSLGETAAGSVLREEAEIIIANYREEVGDLKAKIEMLTNSSEVMQQGLREEQTKLKQELARWDRERSELKKGLGKAKKSREQLEAQLVGLQETNMIARKDSEINVMDRPPPYEDGRSGKSHNLKEFSCSRRNL